MPFCHKTQLIYNYISKIYEGTQTEYRLETCVMLYNAIEYVTKVSKILLLISTRKKASLGFSLLLYVPEATTTRVD